ncbi:hypothetical protein BDV33DRAFT_200093 [Aspergillus novoparasiticus]|uniref:Uncharacterized protein n=1 Tax=Aspergillus novoparasiticus TaxID=986946 RepID=A0A5N6F3D3_9EURO|nr:hypothetical protein BDV33DRAFT_200093 [Aspergillus novoparasiticus]
MFQDEAKRPGEGPQVVALRPNGDLMLDGMPVDVEKTKGADIGSNLAISITHLFHTFGHERLGLGEYNAVRLSINKNATFKGGVVTDLRTAVLVKRNNETDRFLCFVDIKAKADFAYNMVHVIRDLSGNSSANDPISFKPGVQYLWQRISAGFLETRWGEDIDAVNPDEAHLGRLASVLSTTVLDRQLSEN